MRITPNYAKRSQRLALRLAFTAGAGLLCLPSFVPTHALADRETADAQGKLSESDWKFVKEATMGGMAEVELGQLASQKAQNDDVRKFGQRMVTDHTEAAKDLAQVLKKKRIEQPATRTSGEENAAMRAKLAKLEGAEFDKMYIRHMVQDHEEDAAEFKKEAEQGKDPDVKAWAAKTLPIIQEHLQMAKQLNDRLGK